MKPKIDTDNILPVHQDAFYDNARYLIMYGSRGSGKSDCVTQRLILKCLTEKFFRFFLIRQFSNTIAGSCYSTIKDWVTMWGLAPFFKFTKSPITIECLLNGNKFIGAGLDDATKIKSTKDPTGAWFEEDIPDYDSWVTITTSIRTIRGNLQEIFTINPVIEGMYEEHWFYKQFFKGHEPQKTFKGQINVEADYKPVDYSVYHSTHKTNPFLPDTFRAFLASLKKTDPYWHTVYTEGLWANRQVGARAYKAFDSRRNITEIEYDRYKALHLTFDFNVQPYVTCIAWQVYEDKTVQVGEVLGYEPDNSTPGVCKLIKRKYSDHKAPVYIYGDPAGRARDTRDEKGRNDYNIIMDRLNDWNPELRVKPQAPNVGSRVQFINHLFAGNYGGISILINQDCKETINDYLYGKEAPDGSKDKRKTPDPEKGIRLEKYHHISDANDYFLTYVYQDEYNDYISPGSGDFEPMVGTDSDFDYGIFS